MRVITAPEVANLLLTQDDGRILESSNRLTGWSLAEVMRSGRESPPDNVLWTALGDVAFCPDGSRQSFGDSQGIPLDFGSINLRKLNLDGEVRSELNDPSSLPIQPKLRACVMPSTPQRLPSAGRAPRLISSLQTSSK